ncbi:MAG: AAA family ATPase [Acidobacteriia bacterium]|nr:AAA family ATPase [Terriglobia bacterium]
MYPLTAGIVIETKELWDALQSSLQDLPVRIVLEQSEVGELSSLLERIERIRPDVIFLDISTLRVPLDQVIRGIRALPGSPAVLAVNRTAEPATILNAMRAGAAEFLFPPMNDLRAALERIGNERKTANQAFRRGGHTVGFISAKGGCGATTIACHTAVELPQRVKGKILLADLDFDAGMVGFLLKSKATYSIADAVRNTQRLDENYWKALVTNGFVPGLEIVTAPGPGARQPLKPEQLRFVLSFLRTQYDWIILDLGRSLNASSVAALDEVDDLFLVTTLEVPALHQAKLIIQKLLDSGYGANRLHLVLNRAPKRFDVTLEELERMLGAPVYATLPDDYQALNESYTEGKLLSPGSTLGKHFSRLAMKIVGAPESKKKFSLFG